MNEAEATYDYVGFWRRLLASSVDNITWVIGGSILLGYLPTSVWEDHRAVIVVVVFVLLSAWFNYFALSEWRWGQTIGKNATGIEVRSLDGAERLTFGQASVRNLLRIVDFFLIGEVMIIATERKQRLGDRLARTVVVRRASPGAPVPIRGGGEPVATEPRVGDGAHEPEPTQPAKRENRLPPVPWTPKDTVWGLIGGLLLAIIVPPLLVAPFDPELESDGALLAAQGMFDVLLLVVAVAMASGWKFRPLGRALGLLGLRRFQLTAIGIMVATLVAYYIAAGLFATLVLKPDQEDIGGDLGVGNPSVLIAVTAVVMIVMLAPVAEELFFRGFVFAGLRSRWPLWSSSLVSGLIFGLVHAPTGITTVVPLAALGFALCWLYDRTGSLWPCVIAHAINNGLALALVS
jgi:CAAX protease family protein